MSIFLKKCLKSANKIINFQVVYRPCSAQSATSPTRVTKDVPGLSKKIVDVPTSEVGPGASKKSVYKNPEYYCYHNGSYFEAEVEMMKYRLPQPTNKPATK